MSTTDLVQAATRGVDLPRPVVAAAAIVTLAGLDLLGALLARRWSESGGGPAKLLFFTGGIAVFVVLFAVYAASLRVAQLVPVTFGWIALLQVGLLIVDAAGRHRTVPAGHWAAAAAIIALEGYLLFAD
jgi:hypothetical protein